MRPDARQALAHKITWACGKVKEALIRKDREMALAFLRDAEGAWTDLKHGMRHAVLAEKLPAEAQAERALIELRTAILPQKYLN